MVRIIEAVERLVAGTRHDLRLVCPLLAIGGPEALFDLRFQGLCKQAEDPVDDGAQSLATCAVHR